MAKADCGRCRRGFTSVTAFDRHLHVDYSRDQAVTCMDPAERGLVLRGGRWSLPSSEGMRQLRELDKATRAAAGANPPSSCDVD